jgi:hypothetical protein
MYSATSKDATITVVLTPGEVTWSPNGTWLTTDIVDLSGATSLGGSEVVFATSDSSCSVAKNKLTFSGSGDCVVIASAIANDMYTSALTNKTFTAELASTSISWSPTTAVSTTDIIDLDGASPVNGEGAITYSTTSQTCVVSSGKLSFTGAGDCVVTASASETTMYAAASIEKTFVAEAAPQTIAWNPDTSKVATESVVLSGATNTGDGLVRYSTTSDICEVTNGILTFTDAGDCIVTATAEGSAMYLSASVSATFKARAEVIVTFERNIIEMTTLATVSVKPEGAKVTFTGTYGCSDAGFPSGPTGGNFQIVMHTPNSDCWIETIGTNLYLGLFLAGVPYQEVTWSPNTSVLTTDVVALTGVSSSGDGIVTFKTMSENCSIVQGSLSFSGAGNCVVTAVASGTKNYQIGSTTRVFSVGLVPASVQWSPETVAKTTDVVELSGAQSDSGGFVSYKSSDDSCFVMGTSLHFSGAGDCVVTASAGETAMYSAASTTATFSVSLSKQSVVWSPDTAVSTTDVVQLSGAQSDSGVVVFSTSDSICSVTAGALSFSGAGDCVVTASAGETAMYSAASTTATFTAVAPLVTTTTEGATGTTISPSTTIAVTTLGVITPDLVQSVTDTGLVVDQGTTEIVCDEACIDALLAKANLADGEVFVSVDGGERINVAELANSKIVVTKNSKKLKFTVVAPGGMETTVDLPITRRPEGTQKSSPTGSAGDSFSVHFSWWWLLILLLVLAIANEMRRRYRDTKS